MEAMEQVAAVTAVLALLGGTLWWLRRRGFAVAAGLARKGGRRLECMERIVLGPQQTLHLVRLGDRALLVASSPAGCALLHNLDWRDVASAPEGTR
jgi:flagellar biosynthetic protein FliO